jgi:4'-phosphopantetheinyl transferase
VSTQPIAGSVVSRRERTGRGDVCIWLVTLDRSAAAVERLRAILTEDERKRADRFHFHHDAMRWTVARATLRSILGETLGVEPGQVRFVYGERGKPELAEPFARSGVRFNLSHSAGLALCALTEQRRIGVDIERVRPLADLERLADLTFSPRERAAIRRLAPEFRHEAFFNCWTRKEAYIKAIGEGLAHPLDRFSVSLVPGAPARLECVDDDPAEAKAWMLEALAPSPGYTAAVIVEGHPERIVCETWPEDVR